MTTIENTPGLDQSILSTLKACSVERGMGEAAASEQAVAKFDEGKKVFLAGAVSPSKDGYEALRAGFIALKTWAKK